MLRRLMVLAIGIALAATVALVVPSGVGRASAFLVVVLVESVVALVAFSIGLAPGGRPAEAVDETPPDGEAPLVGLPGVEIEPNAVDPAIGRYLRATPWDGPARVRPSAARGALRGRVGLFSLFVGRDGSGWSDREIAEAFASLDRMGRWVEREASRWGAPVNVERIAVYFEADDPAEESIALAPALDPFRNVLDEADADVRGISSASRAAARLGFADLADLIGRIDPRADHDRTVWFVHLLREGRSSAVAPDRFRFPGVGVTLCHARESSASGPLVGPPYVDPVTLAHEFLHLFGATDKYGTPLASFPPRSVTSSDVMRLDRSRLGRLRVDPLTAVEIGWTRSGIPRNEGRPASSRT